MNSIELTGIGMTSQRTRERLIKRLQTQGVDDTAVLDVMRNTPRHLFVDEALSHRAYEDVALPIGFNQTISQPYIVGLMTQLLLSAGPRHKVLEVGTGSGYQTAVLAQLVDNVYSLERIKALHEKARQRLRRLKHYNVTLRHSDGTQGWPDHAPFDGILSAAAPSQLPESLLEQLAVGGILVSPVGDKQQALTVVKRTEQGLETQKIVDVCFVPFVSGVR